MSTTKDESSSNVITKSPSLFNRIFASIFNIGIDIGIVFLAALGVFVGIQLRKFSLWILAIPPEYTGLVRASTGTPQVTFKSGVIEWSGMILWLISIAVIGGAGLITIIALYSLITPSAKTSDVQKKQPIQQQSGICSNCHEYVPESARYCPHCQTKLV